MTYDPQAHALTDVQTTAFTVVDHRTYSYAGNVVTVGAGSVTSVTDSKAAA